MLLLPELKNDSFYLIQISDLNGRIGAVNKKLNNNNYINRAPKKIIQHEQNKSQMYEDDLLKLQKNLKSLKI